MPAFVLFSFGVRLTSVADNAWYELVQSFYASDSTTGKLIFSSKLLIVN